MMKRQTVIGQMYNTDKLVVEVLFVYSARMLMLFEGRQVWEANRKCRRPDATDWAAGLGLGQWP